MYRVGASGENQSEGSALNGRNLRSTFDPVGSIRLILSTSGDEAPAKLRRHSDGGFARSWRRALYYRDRLSPLAGAAFPQRNMAQLRAGRGQLSLRSYSAWGGDGPNVRRHLFTI